VTTDRASRIATEEHVAANGATLWTAVQGDGPPLVLCHGGPGVYDYLGPVADMVDDLATVYRYDQRGCGRSEGRPPYDVDTFVSDLEALRKHWGIQSWLVGGHSWGANLALAYCLAHPEHAAGLVQLSGTGISVDWQQEHYRNREARLSPEERDRLRHLQERRKVAAGAELEAIRAERSEIILRTELYDSSGVRSVPTYDQYPLDYQQMSMMAGDWDRFVRQPGLESRVAELQMPALVVYGEGDTRPEAPSRRLAELLPRGLFEWMPRAGHDLWVEQPDALGDALRSFLQNQAATQT